MVRVCVVFPALLASVACTSWRAHGQEYDDSQAANVRRYSKGPLEASDFSGAVPNARPRENGVPIEAFTLVDIAYDVRYRSRKTASRTRLTLTSIDIYAVVDRSKSWSVGKLDDSLLDHEQGHFDLAAIYALRVQFDFNKQMDEGRGLTTVGANETDAALAMRREIDRLTRTACNEMIKANQRYDRVTAHGSDRTAQRRERKKQLDELSRLIEEVRKPLRERFPNKVSR